MDSSVIVGLMNGDSISAVPVILARFDALAARESGSLRRRQFFRLDNLAIHLRDFRPEHPPAASGSDADGPEPATVCEELTEHITPYRPSAGSSAELFYNWAADPDDGNASLHSTVIVTRMDPHARDEVTRRFRQLDATDFPYRMGTRRRRLYVYEGLYLHIQDFAREDDGAQRIDTAWREADHRFVRICSALDPLMTPYAPDTWRSRSDHIATRLYHWESR
ncbi:TcmI family type II polyketide cyclase [Streptomyces xiamenensis]